MGLATRLIPSNDSRLHVHLLLATDTILACYTGGCILSWWGTGAIAVRQLIPGFFWGGGVGLVHCPVSMFMLKYEYYTVLSIYLVVAVFAALLGSSGCFSSLFDDRLPGV